MLANKPFWNRASQCVAAKIPKCFVWIQLSGFNTPAQSNEGTKRGGTHTREEAF